MHAKYGVSILNSFKVMANVGFEKQRSVSVSLPLKHFVYMKSAVSGVCIRVAESESES